VTGLMTAVLNFLGRHPERWVLLPLALILAVGGWAQAQMVARVDALEAAQSDTEALVRFLACRQLEGDHGRDGSGCRYVLPERVRSEIDAIARNGGSR
jgi:hypothetical protein